MKTLCCDVGSSSVRVAIFEYERGDTLKAKPLAIVTESVTIYNDRVDYYEQKSAEIWRAFCRCSARCLRDAGLLDSPITDFGASGNFPIDSIAFSATCSLVVVEERAPNNGNNNNNNNNGKDKCDIIMWMDHRAKREAERITRTGHEVLNQFGGKCSPEFSLAKLLWLYRNDRARFDSASGFMELSDWLTYRCSQFAGSPRLFPRSLCCVVCKWGYDAVNRKWRDDLFEQLGMTWNDSLRERIGSTILNPGIRAASLSLTAAKEIGFVFSPTDSIEQQTIESVSLSSSLIDAHAGVMSMLVFGDKLAMENDRLTGDGDMFENIFCMISGTSTCHMVLNKQRTATAGVWGPYLDAIIPGYYLREAGQSATGKLIEHVIRSHFGDRADPPAPIASIIIDLNRQLSELDFNHQTALIVNPAFHGNRSPIGNPNLRGAIYGFTLDSVSLLDRYVATVEAIAYETRYIVEEIEKNSTTGPIRKIIVTGGLTKNELYLRLHADILGIDLITFSAGDADLMLVGASVIAWTAAQSDQSSITDRLRRLRVESNGFAEYVRVYKPRTRNAQYHNRKYQCYRRLLQCCVDIESILSSDH